MSSLKGKVALVTGASRGIGRAIAERLGREGANVVITYAGNREKAETAIATIQGNGVQAIAIQSDISNIEDTRNLFERILNTFGQVDIVVNNLVYPVAQPSKVFLWVDCMLPVKPRSNNSVLPCLRS